MRYPFAGNLHKVLLGLLAMLLFWSCIDDRAVDCPPSGLSLRFAFTHNQSGLDQLAQQIQTVDVFVYDKDGNFIDKRHVAVSDLKPGYHFDFPGLPPGDYTLVGWANMNPEYFDCVYSPHLSDMQVSLLRDAQDVAPANSYSLFHGLIQVNSSDTGVKIVDLTKNTKKIKIIAQNDVTYSQPKAADEPYTVVMTGYNGSHKYDNSPADNSQLHYSSVCSPMQSGGQHCELNVMRLLTDAAFDLEFRDHTGKTLYRESLIERILRNPAIATQRDLDRIDEFTFYYNVKRNPDGTFVFTLLKINDWQVIDTPGGIG